MADRKSGRQSNREPNKPADTKSELRPDDEKWVEQTAEQMRAQASGLPAHIQSRLTTARHTAISQGLHRPFSERLKWPALAATTIFAAFMSYTLLGPTTVDQLPLLDETEMAAAQETELLQELEFVAWMEALEMGDELETSSQG